MVPSHFKKTAPYVVLCAVLLLVVNFQNCSGGASSADYGDGTVGQNDPVVIPPGGGDVDPFPDTSPSRGFALNFQAGQTYTGQTLVASGSFIDSLMQRYQYASQTSYAKAVAASSVGLGFVSLGATPAEAERMAVEGCNLLTGRPCALILSGNQFVISKEDIDTNSSYLLSGLAGSAFSANRIPIASSAVRSGDAVASYVAASENKALAISMTGGVFATYTVNVSLSVDEVKRMAVQQCELESALAPCILYAVNDQVVFSPQNWRKQININFHNNNVKAIAPPASRDGALPAITKLVDTVSAGNRYAIYITPTGYGFFGEDASLDTAKQEGLSHCQNAAYGRCIEYATSVGVTLTPEGSMKAKGYGDLFCRTPRYNCAEHLGLGCPSGSYWVQNPVTFESEWKSCTSN